MARQNVTGLKTPERKIYNFDVATAHNPGVIINIKLQDPDFPTVIEIAKLSQEYISTYLTPDKNGECVPFPLVDGKQVKLSEELFNLACTITGLQYGPPEDLYCVEDIINLIHTMSVPMAHVSTKAQELANEFIGLIENPTQAATTPQLDSMPSPSEDTLN